MILLKWEGEVDVLALISFISDYHDEQKVKFCAMSINAE